MSEEILTKEYIESLGYEVEEIDYRIFLIKNFVGQDEIDKIFKFINNLTQDDWETHYLEGVEALAKVKFGRTDVSNLIEEGLIRITTKWVDKVVEISKQEFVKNINGRAQKIFDFRDDLKFNGFSTVQRMYEGSELVEHFDNSTDHSLVYAGITYLNDDYKDGQIFFKNQNIKLVPEPGSFLVFPTTEEWTHGVYEVGEGPCRYVVPSFISKKDFWKIHKDNEYNLEKTMENSGWDKYEL